MVSIIPMAAVCCQYHAQTRPHLICLDLQEIHVSGARLIDNLRADLAFVQPFPAVGLLDNTDLVGAGPGPIQQQRSPLFPAGTGPPTHGHPVFPIGQAPGLAAISNPSSEPASQPQPMFPFGQGVAPGAALAQSHVPIAAADAQPAMQPRLRAVFPIGQGAASGGHLALSAVPIPDLSARPALQPQPVVSAVQPAASSAPLAPGLAGGLHLSAEPLGQPQLAGLVASLVHAAPHPQQTVPSPAAGGGDHFLHRERHLPALALYGLILSKLAIASIWAGAEGKCHSLAVDPFSVSTPPCIWFIDTFKTVAQICAGYGTPNGSMHTTPAQYDAPVLDKSNPAVIWKAIDMSMVCPSISD